MPANMSSDVLLIYASKPSGHQNAASAISAALSDANPKLRIAELDFFTRGYPLLGPAVAALYLEVVQKLPEFWEYIYHNREIEEKSREIRKLFNFIQLPKIKRYLKSHNPIAVISTHAATTGILSGLKENGGNFFLAGVVTDFSSHNYWPNQGVDLYCVPVAAVKEELLARGISGDKIEITGIPVRREFNYTSSKEKTLENLGLRKNIFTLLIMGGNHGLGSIEEIVRLLSISGNIVQVLVVCGNNAELFKKLNEKNHRKNSVKILGYVNNISELMDASDLLVAKAGGITIAEAIHKKLPMIIFNPLPAQETKNTEYLVKNKAAVFCRDADSLLNEIRKFSLSPSKLIQYKKNMQKIMPLNSGSCIANIISNKISAK